jgi:hypothetical protein
MDFIGCIFPGCHGIALYRRLCSRHYRRVSNDVRYGRTTWEEAEKQGRCGPCIRGKDGLLRAKK